MMDTEICSSKKKLALGEHTEVDVECGVEVAKHGEYHRAGKTLKEGEDGAPDELVQFIWRNEAEASTK